MKTFTLQQKNGRVVLDSEKARGWSVIRTIEAETWIDARDQIYHLEFEHKQGYGYVAN